MLVEPFFYLNATLKLHHVVISPTKQLHAAVSKQGKEKLVGRTQYKQLPIESKMDAEMEAKFNQKLKLEEIRRGAVKVLDLGDNFLGVPEVRALSTVSMNENNKVNTLNLSQNNFGAETAICV